MTLALVAAGALTLGLPVASAQMLAPDPFGPSADVSWENHAEADLFDYCEWGGDTQFCTGFFAREVYEEGTGRFQFTALLLQRQVTAPTYNFMRWIVCRVPKRILRITAVDVSFPQTPLDPNSEDCGTGGYRYDCDENGENCSYNGDYGYTNIIWVQGDWNKPVYTGSSQGVTRTTNTETGDRFVYNCTGDSRTPMTEGGLYWGPSNSIRFIAFNRWVISQFTSQKCTLVAKSPSY